MPHRKYFELLFLLLIAAHTNGQNYYFKHYQADQGLAHNNVVTIMQDSKGFMWFGTKGGLNRFDGYTFKLYKNKANQFGTIGNNVIISIAEDHQGDMWIGTGRGLFRYTSRNDSFTEIPFAHDQAATHILVDTDDNIYLLVSGQLFHYDQQQAKPVNTGLHGACLSFDKDRNLWLGHNNGSITCYNPQKNTQQDIQIVGDQVPAYFRGIDKIDPSDSSLVLIGTTKQGLLTYNRQTGRIRPIITRNADGTEIYVRDIVSSRPGEYWIGTESGIYIYNSRTNTTENLHKNVGDEYSLSDNAIYSLCRDRQGGLWAGTFFGGLNYFSAENARFKKYYPIPNTNSIKGNAVREIGGDSDDNIWIGTEDAGINKLNTHTGQFNNYTTDGTPQGLSYPNIHGLLPVGDRLYAGPFQHGLEIMDIHTGKVIDRFKLVGEPDSMVADFVMSLGLTKDSAILVGTTGNGAGLYTFDPKQRRFTKIRQMPWGVYIYSLAEDHDATIWTGSLERGTFWFNPKTHQQGNIRFADTIDGKPTHDYQIQGIFEDSDNALWFATEGGGLIRLSADRKSFRKFTTNDGMPTNTFFRILEDDDKHIWVSSLRGLICLDIKTRQFKVYTQSNGLITDQFNYHSAYRDRLGRMYFGSVKGMISFDPKEFAPSSFTPPTYITGIRINNNKDLPAGDSIILAHDQSTFSIEFATLSYSSPDVTRYKYRMAGLDKDWTYLDANRKAYFTDLSPGRYTFLVQAVSNVKSWTGLETKVYIRILPPWWKSTLAWIGYAVATLLIIWLSIRIYRRYLLKKQQQKMRLFEHEKEKEVYEAKIEFFTNIAHEIQTPLTLILGPLEMLVKRIEEFPALRKSLTMMDKNGKRLLELTNQLLDFRRTEASQFGLSFVKADIHAIIEEQIAIFKPEADKLHISVTPWLPATPLIAYIDREAFVKILTNLLSNAIKYAASRVTITVGQTAGSFEIYLANDGKGIPAEYKEKIFDPFFRLSGAERSGTGIGLSLARSLTDLHKGSLTLISGETNNIIFALTLPVHQQFEFDLSSTKKIRPDE